MTAKAYKPTEAELEILNVLWKIGPSTVREVHNEILKSKNSGYTTTLKLMQIMLEKGILKRDKGKKGHIYNPVIKENDIQKYLVRKLVDSAFSGSASKLILHALGNHKASREEINKIRKLLDSLENE